MDLVFAKLKSLARDIKGVFKINSDNDNRQVNITININNINDPGTLGKIKNVVKEAITESDQFKFDSEKIAETECIVNNFLKSGSENNSREFIQKYIPEKDKSTWFSSLILREEFNKGNTEIVGRIKNQIVSEKMERGRNIANLCSAGYLETLIMPLHTTIDKNKNLKIFYEIYETIVMEYPFAVFVSSNKAYKEIKKEIIDKIKHVKSYGWKKVSIHGIGEENVKTIQNLIVEIKEECSEISNIDFNSHNSEGKIITISITIN